MTDVSESATLSLLVLAVVVVAIRQWRPWERSAGTRTSNGKEEVARNAFRGGARPMLRAIAASLKEQRRALESS